MKVLSNLWGKSYKTFSTVPNAKETLIFVNCPICRCSRVRSFWKCDGFTFSRCVNCGHLYQNPMPKPQDLFDRYDEEYKNYEVENSENFFALMRLGLRDAGFYTLEKSLGSQKWAIDIGCATGVLVHFLQNRGWNAEGLEVCHPAAEYGMKKRGVRIHIGTLESLHLDSEKYDLVHFSHVIEHLPDIHAFLAEVKRITKKGGHVIITTPNRRSLQALLMAKNWRSAIADHTHLFSPKELRILLEAHGFFIQRWKTWGGIPLGMASQRVKSIVDRLMRITGFGDVIMVIAQRQW